MRYQLGGWILLFMTGLPARADLKIGIVNMTRAVQATADGKKAQAVIESEFNKKKKSLEQEEADLQKKSDELEKKKVILSEEAFAKKQSELQSEFNRFRDSLSRSQMDIQRRQQDLLKPILEKFKKVFSRMISEKGYTLILEESPQVLSYPSEENITEEVIRLYNLLGNS